MNFTHFINVTKKVYQLACNRQTGNNIEAIQQLENYMYQLTFDEIKFIQTIMYLGRDTTDEERLKYSNKELFESQKRYLERKSWSKRELEADHIIAKTPLDEYLQKGLEIVNNLDIQLSFDNNNLNIENEQIYVKNQKESNFMSQYYKIEVVDARIVNSYLEKGWVLIDTTRELSSYGEISISYHMGYPINSYIADLKGIIDKYEELGLFEELKKRLCEKEGLDPRGLREESFYFGDRPKNEVVNFLNHYVNLLKNEKGGNYIYVDPSSEKKEEPNLKETVAVTVDEDDLPF
ncbi:hypothetical protein ACIQXG_10485 [Lysinibacillus sphaericus]|uniref:hypothetical protein n=1 Tax=Lysinibacillus sphaericus TaxID=1421 RepID=UPI003812BCBF